MDLDAPTIGSLLTLTGNAAIVALLVTLIKRTAALTEPAVHRFGPLISVACGILLALFAGLVVGLERLDLAQAVFTGFVSGAFASGLYNLAGQQIQQAASTITGGRIAPPGA